MSSPEPSVSGTIRTMQIIAGALIAGSTVLLIIVVFLVQNKGPQAAIEDQPPIVSLLSVVWLLILAPIAFWVPGTMLKKTLASMSERAPDTSVLPAGEYGPGGPVTDPVFLLGARLAGMIVAMAMFEGASFFGSIAYLIEGQRFALGVAVAGILLIMASFPTQDRVLTWMETQRRALLELRSRKGTWGRS